jgi:uncharacterized membrane protein
MWIILGILFGAAFGLEHSFEATLGGAIIGGVIGAAIQAWRRRRQGPAPDRLALLEARVADLEEELARLRDGAVAATAPVKPAATPDLAAAPPPAVAIQPDLPPAAAPEPAAIRAEPAFVAPPQPPGTLETLVAHARAWLLGGNTVVRVGLLVLFFGLAFLARYAVEHSLVPVEFRLAGIAAGGIALLGVGWRLRRSRTGYAMSMQGGGVAVLYLTVFAAMRMYALLPPQLAFALLLAIVAFSAVLAVLQDSAALAVIGTAGGFLAPILASTGQGSHVQLFSYYLALNAGVLFLAWKKAWRVLNLVGFAFTFSIALAWGARDYRPELFASTEPFLIAFFLMYVAAAVLYAWRQAPALRHYVDGTLVFGTPVVGFGLQAALVRHLPYGMAWSALAAGALYLLLARWLQRSDRPTLRLLVESFLALGIAFVTLTIPLALDGRWTAAAWAMEGAALLWVGTRQSRKLAIAAGLLLQFAAGVIFAEDGGLSSALRAWPVVNSHLVGAALIALGGFFGSRIAERQRAHWPSVLPLASVVLLVWASLWWLAGGLAELDVWLTQREMVPAALAFFALSGALASRLAVRLAWPALHWPGLVAVPGMALALASGFDSGTSPADGWGPAAWLLALACHGWALHAAEGIGAGRRVLGWAHTLGLWLITAALVWGLEDALDRLTIGVAWSQAATLLGPVMALMLLVVAGTQGRWPVSAWSAAYLRRGGIGIAAALLLWASLLSIFSPGLAGPLPFVPLANPLDLALAAAVLASLRWWQVLMAGAPPRWLRHGPRLLALVAFGLANGALLRAMHHLGGVRWSPLDMLGDDAVQAALSLFWGLSGLALTFAASRGGRRGLWMSGAALLAVVVAKLFLVDMENTGTVARIVSFLGAGVLLLVVGYFSPLPPAREKAA